MSTGCTAKSIPTPPTDVRGFACCRRCLRADHDEDSVLPFTEMIVNLGKRFRAIREITFPSGSPPCTRLPPLVERPADHVAPDRDRLWRATAWSSSLKPFSFEKVAVTI